MCCTTDNTSGCWGVDTLWHMHILALPQQCAATASAGRQRCPHDCCAAYGAPHGAAPGWPAGSGAQPWPQLREWRLRVGVCVTRLRHGQAPLSHCTMSHSCGWHSWQVGMGASPGRGEVCYVAESSIPELNQWHPKTAVQQLTAVDTPHAYTHHMYTTHCREYIRQWSPACMFGGLLHNGTGWA